MGRGGGGASEVRSLILAYLLLPPPPPPYPALPNLPFYRPHIPRIPDMDAFTIASPVPIDEPGVEVFVDREDTGTSGDHSGCVIA